MRYLFVAAVVLVLLSACLHAGAADPRYDEARYGQGPAKAPPPPLLQATFAGGCFWCMEGPFEAQKGVVAAISGYTGGPEKNPAYKPVARGETGHTEAVLVIYDPRQVNYQTLLERYWRSLDPTDIGGQFADRGKQYRPAIFVHSKEQERLAKASKIALGERKVFSKPIVVPIQPAEAFWPAEDYHQNYYRTNPEHYKKYRVGSGRSGFLAQHWKDIPMPDAPKYDKPKAEDIKEKLDELQYRVTQQDGTERPFANKYWDNKEAGLYLDVVSGEPLFASVDKFESGTGWPSFFKALEPDNVVEKQDKSHGMVRVEVRSKNADSHLGHLFPDGPKPTGLRYCINSAALRFVPVADLEKEGLQRYKALFDQD